MGALLRIALTVDMPYGYTQYDSADFLTTTRVFITEHRLHINPKRSFVSPVLFSLPFLLPVPALVTIPIAQHLLGLVAILITGGIVRLWFTHWKWFVIPVTLLVGANPMIIWYEHTLLGEFQYLFFELLAALAGSIWVKRPSRLTFGFFLASLLLVTGTRLEGKLFFFVALALIPFVLWGRWRSLLIHAALTLGLMAIGFAASGGRDGSPLLLATMIHLAPDHLKSSPGLEPYMIPLRDELRIRFPEYPGSLVKTSKRVEEQVDRYLEETCKGKLSQGAMEAKRATVMRGLCVEIFEARPLEVLKLPLVKFRLAVDAWSAYCWNDHYLHVRQVEALDQKPWMLPVLSKGLTGRTRTLEETGAWVNAQFDEKRTQWFTHYQGLWNDAGLYFRTPDRPATQVRSVHDFFGGVEGGLNTLPGIPFFYMAALAGMFAAIMRWRDLGCFHLMWAGCMLATMYAALMVGVTNGRFRFAYEPFFFIYCLLLLDSLIAFLSRLMPPFPQPLNQDGK
ncbi:MAG: hypothetical protein WCO68_05810 [Verrucomicrobiota bacterium]